MGTEHLLVNMIVRVKKLLDNQDISTVLLFSYDWNGAFYRLDLTKVTIKCINTGIRSSVIKVVIYFLKDRKMQVKFNKHTSTPIDLTGGSPQGFILGQFSSNRPTGPIRSSSQIVCVNSIYFQAIQTAVFYQKNTYKNFRPCFLMFLDHRVSCDKNKSLSLGKTDY